MSAEELDSYIVRFLPVKNESGVYWIQIGKEETTPSIVSCTAQGVLQILPVSSVSTSSAVFPQPIAFFLDSGTLTTTSLSIQSMSFSDLTTTSVTQKSVETTTICEEPLLSLSMWIGIALVAIAIVAIIIYYVVKLRHQQGHENRSFTLPQMAATAAVIKEKENLPVSQVRLNANFHQLPKFFMK
jgi:hypothetical protein